MEKSTPIGNADNVVLTYSRDRATLTITVDLTKEIGPSKSGKTVLVATTAGSVKLQGPDGMDLRLGLNVYKMGG